MDIGSGKQYPSSALSNFAPHPFVLDGVEISSMEGWLQSLKYKNPDMQREVCKLVGKAAKFKGKKKNWKRNQTLFWLGEKIYRHSEEYQSLLDRAYEALSKNSGFKSALLASGKATLDHSIGRNSPRETVLTVREFTGRLSRIRDRLMKE